MENRNEHDMMDQEIERDVTALRELLDGVEGPSEPHPAYWQNFLIRVHETIEAEQNPKRKPWWSPALIWGSLTGVALLLVVAYSTDIFPFSDSVDNIEGVELLADAGEVPPAEELVLVPTTSGDDMMTPDDVFVEGADADDVDGQSLILSQEDIDMLNAIQSEDDDAILRAMIDSEI